MNEENTCQLSRLCITELSKLCTKGQFISKGLFDFLNSSKKRTKYLQNFALATRAEAFRLFLEDLRTRKFASEIIWPLLASLTAHLGHVWTCLFLSWSHSLAILSEKCLSSKEKKLFKLKSELLNVLLLLYIQGLRFAFGYLPRVPSTMQMCTQSERTKKMELNLRAKVKIFFKSEYFKKCF